MLTSVRSLMAATLLVGSAFVATPVLAQDDEEVTEAEVEADSAFSISGNVALVSDYRFRGIGLSGGDFAIHAVMQFAGNEERRRPDQ